MTSKIHLSLETAQINFNVVFWTVPWAAQVWPDPITRVSNTASLVLEKYKMAPLSRWSTPRGPLASLGVVRTRVLKFGGVRWNSANLVGSKLFGPDSIEFGLSQVQILSAHRFFNPCLDRGINQRFLFFGRSISQASHLNSVEIGWIAKFRWVDSTKSCQYSAEFVKIGLHWRHRVVLSPSGPVNHKPLLVSSGAHSGGMH
jgi:hypothetical protein